jgi:hypothetical protein
MQNLVPVIYMIKVETINADTHLESFPVAGDLRYLCVDPVDESLVALLQQAVRLVQDKEPALPEPQSINQTLLMNPS